MSHRGRIGFALNFLVENSTDERMIEMKGQHLLQIFFGLEQCLV